MKTNVIITSEKAIDNSIVYIVRIDEKQVYLYLKFNPKENNYKVYSISEKAYLETLKWHKFNSDNADFIGTIGANEDLNLWIENEQKTKKAFGKTKDSSAKVATLIYSLILLGSLILLSFGIYRISYKKILESRMESTTGKVISYNHQSRNGTVMMGLYNLYVEYTVDGQKYEGHSGTTATEPTVGMSTTVYYDSKHPSHIIVLDEMGERTVLFVVIGGAISVVSFALLVSQISHMKKNRKFKVKNVNTKHVTPGSHIPVATNNTTTANYTTTASNTSTANNIATAAPNVSTNETTNSFSETKQKSIFDKSLKDGFYTNYNGHEYQVVRIKDAITNLTSVYLITEDASATDASFTKDLDRYENFYAKKINPSLLGDVTEYSIDYYYFGLQVGLDKPAADAEKIYIYTTKKTFAEKHDFRYFDRNVYQKYVPIEDIHAKQICKGLSSHFSDVEQSNKTVIKIKEWDMRDKNADQIREIILSRIDNNINLQNFHVGEFIETPNQFGCFKKNTSWFSYSINERNFATITGPFNEKAVVYACAKMLNVTNKFGDFAFTDKERDIYIENNYHSISEIN